MARQARRVHGSPDWWEQLEECFNEFSQELSRHESAENAILQEAYTQDIGDQD